MILTGPYTVGQTVRLPVTFTDPETNALFDPSTVVFKVLAPSATTPTLPTPTRDSLGKWHADMVPTVGGDWSVRVEITGPIDAAERTFTVNPTRFS